MIVEPVPTNPRSPVRRGLRLVATAVPLALLVGVVAAGALGPRPEAETAADVTPSVSPSALDAASAQPAPADGSGLGRTPAGDAFPPAWIGLRVRTVSGTLEEREAGRAQGVVAVAGYFSYGSLPWECADAYLDPDQPCDGRTVLADRPIVPMGPNGTGFGGIGPHLHPQLLPGTRAPAPDPDPGNPRAEPIPVVLLGSFDDPRARPCSPTGRQCDEAFVVQRVVWVAGRTWIPTLTIDPALDVEPNVPEIRDTVRAATAALGDGVVVLGSAVVRPGALAILDEAAAAAIEAEAARLRLRPVTYVRGLVFRYDASQPVFGHTPTVGWVVLDSVTGEVLARAEEPQIPGSPWGPARSPAAP